MNLFKKNKKFEQQLQQQLNNMEVKPSVSLWNRIDLGITKDVFEQDIYSTMEQFEQSPLLETWNKIAVQLPAEKRVNIRFVYFTLIGLVLLFAAGIYIGKDWDVQQQQMAQSSPLIGIKNESNKPIFSNSIKQPTEKKVINKPVATHLTNSNIKPAETNKTTNLKQEDVAKGVSQPSIFKSETAVALLAINNGSQNTKQLKQATAISNSNLLGSINDKNTIIPDNSFVKTLESTSDNDITGALQTLDTIQTQAGDNKKSILYSSGKEIIPINQDSAMLAQKNAAIHSSEDPNQLTRFSISIFAGAHMSFSTYSLPQSSNLNFEENMAFRKQLERPAMAWAGGFLLDYRLNNRWMISSGIMMVNFNQAFDYDIETAVKPANPNEVGAPVYNPNDSFILGNQYSNRIRYSWTEIPIFINLNLKRGVRWDFDMQAGMSYAFIGTIDGGMVSYDNKGVLILRDKESFPQISNTVFATIMPQVSYKFGQAVSIGIVPTAKYSVTSIIGNQRWIQQHPYFMGINVCIRKRF